MDNFEKVFTDLDYLAEKCSKIELKDYQNMIESCQVSADGEQGAYYAVVSKRDFASLEEAFPALFIYNLYENEEWPTDNSMWEEGVNSQEWKKLLKKIWFPEYLNSRNGVVAYKHVCEEEFNSWFPVAEKIASSALRSDIVKIIRYGDIASYFIYEHIVETVSDYVLFDYWTAG